MKRGIDITNILFKLVIVFSSVILILSFFYQKIGLSYHGNFHLSIINQIKRGIVPPENVCLTGVPINYPWAYHLILAIFSIFFKVSPIFIHRFISLMTFLGFCVFAYKSSKLIFKNDVFVLLSTILIVFGVNLLTPLFFLIEYSPGNLPKIIDPSDLIKLMIPIGERYASTFVKFMNFTSYSSGIFLVSVIVYMFIQMLVKKEISFRNSAIVSVVLLIVSFLHPFSALFCITVLLSSFLVTFILINKIKKEVIYFSIMNATSFLVSLPYLLSISDGVKTFVFNPNIYAFFELFVSYPLHFILLFYIYYKYFFRKGKFLPKFKPVEIFLFFSTILVVVSVFLFDLVGGNEYKFVQLLAITLSPLFLIYVVKNFKRLSLSRLYVLVNILVITKLILISFAYFKSDWATNTLAKETEMFNQIDNVSSKTAVIVNSKDKFQDLRGSYLVNRNNYVVICPPHTDGYPNILETRLEMISDISNDSVKYIQSETGGKELIVFTDNDLVGFEKLVNTVDGNSVYLVK